MRLIDADAIYKWYLEAFKGQIKPNEIRFSMNDIRDNLENIPTIDAVSVIRCEDCIYYRQEIDLCDEPHSIAHEDDYCSKAVRKEENDGQTDN